MRSAEALHRRMDTWIATDRALRQLGLRFPGFDLESVLLKVAAINQLYGTNVYGVIHMAAHVVEVMTRWDGMEPSVELVEQIAALPRAEHDRRCWRFFSFAAKFAHFFVDAERFPIYDSYAVRMVSYHLGPTGCVKNARRPYWAFVANCNRLNEYAGLKCSIGELDKYLWLAGVYLEWLRNPRTQINAEARRLFESPSVETVADLHTLCGQRLDSEAAAR